MTVRAEIIKVDWIKKPVMLIPTEDYDNIRDTLLKGQQMDFNIKTTYNEDVPFFTGKIKECDGELDELIRR